MSLLRIFQRVVRALEGARTPKRRTRAPRLALEALEERSLLSTMVAFQGPHAVVDPSVPIAASTAVAGSRLTMAVSPLDPRIVVTCKEANGSIEVDRSTDGGTTWAPSFIDDGTLGTNDGLGADRRLAPTLQFTDNGELFVAYGARDDQNHDTRLVVARGDGKGGFDHFAKFAPAGDTTGWVSSEHPTGAVLHTDVGIDDWSLAVGPSSTTHAPAVYVTYVLRDTLGPDVWFHGDLQDKIEVSGSLDDGNTFVNSMVASQTNALEEHRHPSLAVGPNGELYVSWLVHKPVYYGPLGTYPEYWKLEFNRKLDGLSTIHDFGPQFPKESVAGLVPQNVDQVPFLAVDRSGGPHNGRLYLAINDAGTSPNVLLMTSDNGGTTWTSHTVGQTVSTAHPAVTVDQGTGVVYIAYPTSTGVRLASSFDSGNSFILTDVATAGSSADVSPGVAAQAGTVHVVWATPQGMIQTATVHHRGALAVFGEDRANFSDTIEVGIDPNNARILLVHVNGHIAFDGPANMVTGLSIYGRAGNNHVSVDAIPAGVPTVIDAGSGTDTIDVGVPSEDLARLQCDLTVTGGAGTCTLNVHDQQPSYPPFTSFGAHYLITDSLVDWDLWGVIRYSHVSRLSVDTCDQGAYIDVESTSAPTYINATPDNWAWHGQNRIEVSSLAHNLVPLKGPLHINGGFSPTTLTIFDQNDTNFPTVLSHYPYRPYKHYTIANSSVTGPSAAIDYSKVRSLVVDTCNTSARIDVQGTAVPTVVNAGSGAMTSHVSNVIRMLASPGGNLTVHGGQHATNALDYSMYTGNVDVDLPHGLATGIAGGISHIQNVTGGQGDNVLIGNGGNVLTGGTGHNLLVAGASPSTLLAHGPGDILIGGTTDLDIAGLQFALMLESLPDIYALDATTSYLLPHVHSNGGHNTVTGAPGAELIFANPHKDNVTLQHDNTLVVI
jgi:hypothetical protein